MDSYTDGDYLYVRMDEHYLYRVVPVRVSDIPDIFETLIWEEFNFVNSDSVRADVVNYITNKLDFNDMVKYIGVIMDSDNEPTIIDTVLGKYVLMIIDLIPIDNVIYNINSVDIKEYIERRNIEGDYNGTEAVNVI